MTKIMTEHSKGEDSFFKRYAAKIFSNILGIALSMVLAGIVPRSIGVKNFGDYSFLTNIFSQVINFLDLRASTCLFVKLSQDKSDIKLISYYNLFCITITALMSAGVWCITSNDLLRNMLLPYQEPTYVYLALILTISIFVQSQLIKVMDSFGLTVVSEKLGLLARTLNFIIIVIISIYGKLSLRDLFYVNIGTSLLYIYSAIPNLNKSSLLPLLDYSEFKKYTSIFYKYCTPLVVYMVVCFLSEYFDRLILQKYGGSIQQGYYAFAFNISNMSMLAVSTIFFLFTRELSISVGKNDINSIANLFDAYVPTLYVVVSYFSCFVFTQAESLVVIFGGKGFEGASLTLKILSLYSLVSTFSMMSGSIIYATERTHVFRNLCLVLSPIGVIISAILISPIMHYQLGAVGLGIKNTMIELISVIIILYLNSRLINISFKKYFLHMICIPIIFLICAYISSYFINICRPNSTGLLSSFVLSGLVYSVVSVLTIYSFPQLIFKRRSEINSYISMINSVFGGIR